MGFFKMGSLYLALISFGCIFGGVVVGILLRNLLPVHHLKDESKETIKMGAGLIATMAALVLGLLVGSAKSSFDALNDGVKQAGARLILLDKVLGNFGPETKEVRNDLRLNVVALNELIWPSSSTGKPDMATVEQRRGMEAIQEEIQVLKPATDKQRAMQAQALQITGEMLQSRWMMIEHMQNALPVVFLVVVIFWLTMLHLSFGLLAPRNGTVIAVLLVCALSVSGALFLISEMNHPIDGFIKISNAPLLKALDHLGK
jgi:hypothetical protein